MIKRCLAILLAITIAIGSSVNTNAEDGVLVEKVDAGVGESVGVTDIFSNDLIDETGTIETDDRYFCDEESIDINGTDNNEIVLDGESDLEEIFTDDDSVYESKLSTECNLSIDDESFIAAPKEILSADEISLLESESVESLADDNLKYSYSIIPIL